jgi:hypothetical protein
MAGRLKGKERGGTGCGCHIRYCVAEMPTVASIAPLYMTLVIAVNTLQELPRMAKPRKKS